MYVCITCTILKCVCVQTSSDAFRFSFHAVEIEFVAGKQLTYIHLREVFHNAAIGNPEISIRSPPGPRHIGVLLNFKLTYMKRI